MIYLKKVLKSYTIITTENETGARIHGTIYASHKKGKVGKVSEAERPYIRYKDHEKPANRVGQPAYCKPYHNNNGHL